MAGYLSPSATNTQGMSYDALLYCKTNIGGYFFDGFMQVDHTRELEITENPVETGASVVDHAYVKPATIVMKVMMSDALDSFISGQFSDSWSRSASAWSLLKQLQEDRIPMSVLTRLDLYENMIIKRIEASDTQETYTSLSATVTLQEIPVARVRVLKISEEDQVTVTTQMGKIEAEQLVGSGLSSESSILYQILEGLGYYG